MSYFYIIKITGFLSTLSLRRATANAVDQILPGHISIHALLAESDTRERTSIKPVFDFYPRSPCGERHRFGRPIDVQLVFLSTLSLRRATSQQPAGTTSTTYFYPRSPCGERRRHKALKSRRCVFLSTLSLRRATLKPPVKTHRQKHFYPRSPCGERHTIHICTCQYFFNFYPRSPCGERLSLLRKITITVDISIHALLAESDVVDTLILANAVLFLSTLSLRRATH